MLTWKLTCVFFLLHGVLANSFQDNGDNEFAEFEDFDESDQNFVDADDSGSEKETQPNEFVPLSKGKEQEEAEIEEESDEEVCYLVYISVT